jgi:hypothetical protein
MAVAVVVQQVALVQTGLEPQKAVALEAKVLLVEPLQLTPQQLVQVVVGLVLSEQALTSLTFR